METRGVANLGRGALRLRFVAACSAVLVSIAVSAEVLPERSRKVVALGWEFHDVSPQELLSHADLFASTGLDGVEISLAGRTADGRGFDPNELQMNGRWNKRTRTYNPVVFRYDDFAHHVPALRELVKHPCFRSSFVRAVYRSPRRYGRISWRDDAAWARVATNSSVIAAIARDGGVKGLVMDCEDYFNQNQYVLRAGDPTFDEAAALARKRGREVFGAVFREHPSAVILSFWLFSWRSDYAAQDDSVAAMRERGDLWPSFLNGILDVMPPSVTLVDGDEKAYGYEEKRGEYAASALNQRWKALELVEPENHAKYAAQVKTGFGHYLDRYLRPSKIGWFGPVDGTPTEHFRRNFSASCQYAQEYVWLWGEQQSWVKWRGRKPHKRVNFAHTWEDDMKGLCETVALVKRGDQGIASKFAASAATGNLENLVSDASSFDANFEARPAVSVPKTGADFLAAHSIDVIRSGRMTATAKGVVPGDWYAVEVAARGINASAHVRWKAKDGGWCTPAGDRKMIVNTTADGDNESWRRGRVFVRVPPGAAELVVWMVSTSDMGPEAFGKDGSGDDTHHAAFADVAVYKVFQ